MDEMMFCYQCEQAANCTACTGKAGVCGKSAETADAQDKLTGALIGFATLLLDIGRPIRPPQALLLTEGLFTTITNVDFDPQTVAQLTDKVWKAKQEAFASASPAPAPVSEAVAGAGPRPEEPVLLCPLWAARHGSLLLPRAGAGLYRWRDRPVFLHGAAGHRTGAGQGQALPAGGGHRADGLPGHD